MREPLSLYSPPSASPMPRSNIVTTAQIKGVLLQLHGVKVGVELSASVGGVTITME